MANQQQSFEATYALAKWLADLRLDTIPDKVYVEAALCLGDYLGCALLGSTRQQAKQLFDLIDNLGGNSQATLIGYGKKTSLTYAALANGVLGSASWLLEDTAAESFAHPGVNVIPAALAAAEYMGASGIELLGAIIAGYEVAMRVGAAAGWKTFKRGWHPRGSFNVFGAAAATGKLLGLNSIEEFCALLGLAGTQASGLVEPSSPYDAWLLLSGSGAQDGMLAALLAKQGWTAGCTVIEGNKGYLQAVAATPNAERILAGLGQSFEILSITRKRHASSSLTHSAMDLVIDLKSKNNLTSELIEDIEVQTLDVHYLHERQYPRSRLDGPHSLPYLIAVAFLDEEVLDKQFEPNRRDDPVVRDLFDRIRVISDDQMTQSVPGGLPSRVTIRLKDQQVFTAYREYPKGDPREPFTPAELKAKFFRLGSAALSERRLQHIWEWVENAHTEESVRDLIPLLTKVQGDENV